MLASFGILNVIFILSLALSIQSLATAATKPVKKILSLDLCTDWMLAKYADPSQVLALSPLLHQYPVDWMTREWPSHDGSLEQILELKPDLVITGEYNALMLRRRLQELGLRVEILSLPKNFSEVDHYEQRLLSLIGKPVQKTEKLLQAISNKHSNPKLLLLGPNGIGTGRGTFEDDLLQQTGWDNYLNSEGYSNLDLEQIVTHPPDAILWSTPDSVALANLFAKHPVLKQVISKDRWLSTDDWRWHCPGPWSKELIKQLQAQLEEQF
jgi:iron complex transport system substrate-binding protein